MPAKHCSPEIFQSGTERTGFLKIAFERSSQTKKRSLRAASVFHTRTVFGNMLLNSKKEVCGDVYKQRWPLTENEKLWSRKGKVGFLQTFDPFEPAKQDAQYKAHWYFCLWLVSYPCLFMCMTLLRLGANKHSGSTWFASDLLVIEETHSQSLIEIQRIIIINDKKVQLLLIFC